MLNNVIEELKVLAENILKAEQSNDIVSGLDQARELYEKLLVLKHLQDNEGIIANIPETVPDNPQEELADAAHSVPDDDFEDSQEFSDKKVADEEPVLSLNDLFVPTFDGIKEDMSQKDEFKDTISLDDTENLFQVKKEEPRQLSLNDKLVGSSIQVGLNDRIAFVNKLFNFSQSDFNKVLSRLNECSSKGEALKYFEYQVKPNYNWKGKEDLEGRFIELIERKFM